jgi:hypothetical protein
MNDYWGNKRAKAHLIKAPAYVLASMSSALHTIGSLRSFEDIPHEQKWYRESFVKSSQMAESLRLNKIFIGYEYIPHRSGTIFTKKISSQI